jgi:hypothetical protein
MASAILKKFGWDKAAAVTDEKAAEVLALCKAELGEEAEVAAGTRPVVGRRERG